MFAWRFTDYLFITQQTCLGKHKILIVINLFKMGIIYKYTERKADTS